MRKLISEIIKFITNYNSNRKVESREVEISRLISDHVQLLFTKFIPVKITVDKDLIDPKIFLERLVKRLKSEHGVELEVRVINNDILVVLPTRLITSLSSHRLENYKNDRITGRSTRLLDELEIKILQSTDWIYVSDHYLGSRKTSMDLIKRLCKRMKLEHNIDLKVDFMESRIKVDSR